MPPKAKTTTPRKTTAKQKTSTKSVVTKPEVDAFGSSLKHLVIVESPAKAKTLRKILGSHYEIKASVGHVRDLPEKKLGVDIKNNFEPQYEVLANKTDVVDDIKAAAAVCDMVYLAADPDREGEAIAWHIASLLKKPREKIQRIVFHEITKNAILEAMKHPRDIDIARVDAQQARRVLDRLVGYKLSPLLWQKVTKGLSAGRVQSVAVRLICEREAEVRAFIPEEYWTVGVDLHPQGKPNAPFHTELAKWHGEKLNLTNEADAQAVVSVLKLADIQVSAITERESRRNPSAPYITSTLQRDASNRIGYPVKKTMQVAQKLYEGITLGSEGPVGLITYMRTDSTRISEDAQAEAKQFILEHHGEAYYPETPREYSKKSGKNVQDAHEAIRPTSVYRTPEAVKPFLNDEQYKIYELIWDRFVASQMQAAKLKSKTIEITAGPGLLKTTHTKVVFPGYLAVLHHEKEEAEEGKKLPDIKQGDVLALVEVLPKQHFTEPPPRFNEASLVKILEELGIGRPSTYAPTIATIQDRGYVRKEERALSPTELGKTVNDLLVKHFNDIVDVHFTANLENKLDEIAESHLPWQGVIQAFYEPFELTLKQANKDMEKVNVIIDGEQCPNCGLPMALKTSWFGGPFLGCTGYPECKSTKRLTKDFKPVPDDKPSDEVCTECNGSMVIRFGRYGEYLACLTGGCKGRRPLVKKTGVPCSKCQTGEIVEKKSGRGKLFYGCNQYPTCDFTMWNKPINRSCPQCQSLMFEKNLKKGHFFTCSNKDCSYQEEAPEVVSVS